METTEDVNLGGATLETGEVVETNLSVKYGLTEKTGLYAYYAVVAVDCDTCNDMDDATKLGVQLSAKF